MNAQQILDEDMDAMFHYESARVYLENGMVNHASAALHLAVRCAYTTYTESPRKLGQIKVRYDIP